MAREIKFRIWIPERKMFFIGPIAWLVKQLNELGTTFEESLAQEFTGLKDKNGKEICEGDIVKCVHGNCIVEFGKYVVDNDSNEDILGWVVRGVHSAHAFDPQAAYWVIGNVYAHPDLISQS